MASPAGAYSFAPPQHEVDYQPFAGNAVDKQRSVSPASASKKFWPFNRSRSSSPSVANGQASPHSNAGSASRSRKTSANSFGRGSSPQPQGFVVRNVTRQPGGVSVPSSPVDDVTPSAYRRSIDQQGGQPSPRRMTLEDSDDDQQDPHSGLQYRRSKSRPVGFANHTLGVPPGGPGGGVGYGTAKSSNDGRPEPYHSPSHPASSISRPSSPGGNSITAGGFQRGIKERGRSPRKSPSQHSQGHGSTHSRESSASRSGKVIKPMITPGPKSLAQQQGGAEQWQAPHGAQPQQPDMSRRTSFQSNRPHGLAGPRDFPGAPRSPHDQPPTSPLDMAHSPRQSSPLALSHSPAAGHTTSAVSPVQAQSHSAHLHGPPSSMSFPSSSGLQAPDDREAADQSRGRKFSFGIPGRNRKDSKAEAQTQQVPVPAPLQGLPSPVDIPYGRSPGQYGNSRSRSRDPGADTDYSYENGASPFGSVSPAGSVGFSNTMASRGQTADGAPASPGGSGLAGKWFKGIFGRSPRPDETDQNWQGATMYPNANADGDRTRENSPMPLSAASADPERQALAPRQPPNHGRRSMTLPKLPSEDDVEATLMKRESMRQARKIVDAERRQAMAPITPQKNGFDPDQDREFLPKQAVDDSGLDAALAFEKQRRKSPPGRKPVPKFAPSASEEDGLSKLEGRLTPAQRIIQETRSMHLAREKLEAQHGSPRTNPPTTPTAAGSNASKIQPQVQRGFTAPPAAGPSTTATPIQPPPQQQQSQQRNATSPNPSTPAQGRPAPNAGGALSPGSGPMPLDMSLPRALQEMMVRFYRFERYSVPLIRSLETRLLDIEKDAMMAHNPQSGANTIAESAAQQQEMDRWVGQMTRLMKHEVGQLKAATKEIRDGRELVAAVAKNLGSGASIPGSSSMSTMPSLSSVTTPQATPGPVDAKRQEPNLTPGSDSNPSSIKAEVGANAVSPVPPSIKAAGSDDKGNNAARQRNSTSDSSAARQTNISSSTFRSAVPRREPTNASTASHSLVLPAGSRPALDKDEGKFNSPTKSRFGVQGTSTGASSVSERERSTSPNGRPRYTSALGQPMQNGRISPGLVASPTNEQDDPLAASASPSRWAEDQRRYGREQLASPALSDRASIHSSTSTAARSRRDMSVEDRLRALVDGRSTRSRASSFAGSVTDEPSEETESRKVGDDYQMVNTEDVDGQLSPSSFNKSAGGTIKRSEHSPSETAAVLHGKQQSSASVGTVTTNAHTIRPDTKQEIALKPGQTPTLVNKRSGSEIQKRASTFLEAAAPERKPTRGANDAATSPVSAASLSVEERPTATRTGSNSSWRRSVSPVGLSTNLGPPSPTGRSGTSDILNVPSIPTTQSNTIRTSPGASNEIRARAMSYLTSAEAAGTSGDDKVDETASASKAEGGISTAQWMSPSSQLSSSPTKVAGSGPLSSGRISPSKLHANRFGANGSSGGSGPSSPTTQRTLGLPAARRGVNGSTGSSSSSNSKATSTVIGLEKKGIGYSTLTGGAKSNGPAMVGHGASLKERVAFFNSVK